MKAKPARANTDGSQRNPPATLWQPGQSGNPAGRPKGLMRQIREATRDGAELAEFMLRVFRGHGGKGTTLKHRIEACTWLANRGFGLPTQRLDVMTHDEIAEFSGALGLA